MRSPAGSQSSFALPTCSVISSSWRQKATFGKVSFFPHTPFFFPNLCSAELCLFPSNKRKRFRIRTAKFWKRKGGLGENGQPFSKGGPLPPKLPSSCHAAKHVPSFALAATWRQKATFGKVSFFPPTPFFFPNRGRALPYRFSSIRRKRIQFRTTQFWMRKGGLGENGQPFSKRWPFAPKGWG